MIYIPFINADSLRIKLFRYGAETKEEAEKLATSEHYEIEGYAELEATKEEFEELKKTYYGDEL